MNVKIIKLRGYIVILNLKSKKKALYLSRFSRIPSYRCVKKHLSFSGVFSFNHSWPRVMAK